MSFGTQSGVHSLSLALRLLGLTYKGPISEKLVSHCWREDKSLHPRCFPLQRDFIAELRLLLLCQRHRQTVLRGGKEKPVQSHHSVKWLLLHISLSDEDCLGQPSWEMISPLEGEEIALGELDNHRKEEERLR